MEKRIVFVNPTLLKEVEPPPEAFEAFQVSLSTYDIPEEVHAVEDANGVLRLKFIYPDREEEVSETGEEAVVLHTGRHSGKLLGVDLPARARGIDRIGLLARQIHERIATLKRPNQRLNYRLIENVLQRKGEELLTG